MSRKKILPAVMAVVAAAWGLAAAAAGATASFPTLTPAQVAEWQERGDVFLLVDTRPAPVYDIKHARGAISIPAFALATRSLPRSAKVVLYDGGAGATDAETAARTLQSKGQPQFWILEGGLTAWEAQSLPIVVTPGEAKGPLVEPIGVLDLLRLIDQGERVTVLDLRSEDLYKQSRVPGAVSAPDDARIERAVSGLAPADLIVLYDDGSGDARDKAETLRRRGLRAVKYLHGGMLAWRDKNLRVER